MVKVAILTTHLLGTGHLSRALSLGKGLAARGHQVRVMSGGLPAPHLSPGPVELIQLPAVKSDGLNFTTLLTAHGDAVNETYLQNRIATLIEYLRNTQPDVLITELYPFGRRVLRREFDAVLDVTAAQTPRPLILSSIRDILAPPSSAKRAAWTLDRLTAAYDGVLIHADERLVTLDDSWPVADAMRPLLHYTGFVAQGLPIAEPTGDGHNEILVSAGGGPVGQALFEAAIKAAKSDAFGHMFRILVGGETTRRVALQAQANNVSNIVIERPRPDYREMIQRAALSVSQAGYNTLLDVAQSGVRGVIAPFSEGGETEQTDRARAFGARLGLEVIAEADLSSNRLVDAMLRALSKPKPTPIDIAVDGAEQSAVIIEKMLDHHG